MLHSDSTYALIPQGWGFASHILLEACISSESYHGFVYSNMLLGSIGLAEFGHDQMYKGLNLPLRVVLLLDTWSFPRIWTKRLHGMTERENEGLTL